MRTEDWASAFIPYPLMLLVQEPLQAASMWIISELNPEGWVVFVDAKMNPSRENGIFSHKGR